MERRPQRVATLAAQGRGVRILRLVEPVDESALGRGRARLGIDLSQVRVLGSKFERRAVEEVAQAVTLPVYAERRVIDELVRRFQPLTGPREGRTPLVLRN